MTGSLGRRAGGIVVCLAILCSASGCGAKDEGSDPSADGDALALPTSDWEASQGGSDALMEGVLAVDDRDCVYVVTAYPGSPPAEQYVVWPAGYAADRNPGQGVRVTDGDGNVVAVEGDAISAGGGYTDRELAEVTSGQDCLPTKGEVFLLQSDVTVGSGSRS